MERADRASRALEIGDSAREPAVQCSEATSLEASRQGRGAGMPATDARELAGRTEVRRSVVFVWSRES
jgi:hypothetical protein